MRNHKQKDLAKTANTRNGQQSLARRMYQARYLYLLLAPAVIALLLFAYLPMGGLLLAFKELQFDSGLLASPWKGLTYFKMFFNNPQATQLIVNTLVISLMKIVLAFPFPVILALLLNEVRSTRFKRVTQTVSYLPHFVAWVVVIAIVERLFAPDTGLVNEMLKTMGGDGTRFFLMDKSFFYPIMFSSYVWKTIGWNSIIFLAAISSIDPTLYEAGKIDGANKWQEMTRITLPSIKPTLGMVFILSLGDILNAGYEQIYLLYTPGNKVYADILDTYIIRQGLELGQFSYATAIGLIQSVAGLILVIFANWLGKKYMETSIW